jgi:cell division protein FtsQ
MSTTIDHRIADRRRTVTEDGARRRLRRLLVLVFLFGLGGLAGWLLYHSSYLAVGEITVDGQAESRAAEILTDGGLTVGVPTINVRADRLEAALREDPWIAAATVRVTWPGSVTVEVLEREPLGWVQAGEEWLLVSETGAVLDAESEPLADMPLVSVGSALVLPGSTVDPAAIAALEFVAALPDELIGGAVVTGGGDEMSGEVAGYSLLLGYPIDMQDKAVAVAALLESGVPEGAEINVVSPDRPAVKVQPLVESTAEIIGESQPSG